MRKFSKEVAKADVVIGENGQVTKAPQGMNIVNFCGEGRKSPKTARINILGLALDQLGEAQNLLKDAEGDYATAREFVNSAETWVMEHYRAHPGEESLLLIDGEGPDVEVFTPTLEDEGEAIDEDTATLRVQRVECLRRLSEIEKLAGYCIEVDAALMESEVDDNETEVGGARGMLAAVEAFFESEALSRYRELIDIMGQLEELRK